MSEFPLHRYGSIEMREMNVDVHPHSFLGKVNGCSTWVTPVGANGFTRSPDWPRPLSSRASNTGAEVCYARCVSRVRDRESDSIFHPVVPDAIRIMRCGGDGVELRAKIARELERDRAGFSGRARARAFSFSNSVFVP